MASSSTTPVIDLTAPDSPPRRGEDAPLPLVASSLTGARAGQEEQQAQPSTSASASASTGNATTLPLPPRRSQRIPYPAANAPSTPIDLTDDDIEYLGEQRLHLPDLPHAEGNDARPVQGDNYSLMDRLRDVAGMMPFSRHASRSASDSSNLRVIDEDPLRFGVAGPGPAAVAAANARARRYNNPPVPPAIAAAASSSGGNTPHNADANPPAGLNAQRNRQRARNAQQNNNTNTNARIPDDPARYYYRRPPSPPARAAREGRRHQDAYQGVLPHLHHHDDDEDEDYHFDEGDFPDELEFEPGMWDEILGGRGDRAARRGHRIRDIQGRVQNIMQLLGFGGHADHAFNPWAGGGGNALPINNMGFNPGNPPKRKVKAYSVRQSHPNFNKKKDGKDGFERDIVPPPEVDDEEAAAQRKAWEEAKQAMEAEKIREQNEKIVQLPQNGIEISDSTEDSSEASSIATSSKNKGKGRALEIDTTNATLPTSAAAATIAQDADNDDIPILDLAHGSPNTSGSATSSTLFSGKLSDSTRGTSAEVEQTDDSSKLKDSSAVTTTATNITAAAAPPSEAPPTKPPTRRVRVPVCTSCSTALYLNQSTTGRPYILVCGHVICRGCLDTATERYKRWTAEEVIGDDADIEVPSSAKDKNGWKGAKLKESFVEVDRSRSSTLADTSNSTATRAKDRKGKQKVNMRIGAPGSSSALTTSASTSQAGPGPSTSASTSTRTATRASRRNASRPSYADLDGDEEGLPDTNYVPRSTREGRDDEDMDDDIPVPSSSSKTTKKRHSNRIESDSDNDSDQSVLAELTFPLRNTYRPPESNTDETGNNKGKGKAKAQPNGDTTAGDTEATTSNNKRKRATADEGTGATTTTATDSKKSTKSSTAAPAKKQKVEKPPLIDHDWLSCPVRECKAGTDLGRPIGSREGAWELFV